MDFMDCMDYMDACGYDGLMKIVVAPDSFKECLSAERVAQAIAAGVRRACPDVDIDLVPMADGGEGTVDALVAATSGTKVSVEVTGPLGQRVQAEYGVLGDGQTAVIEMAAASGLALVPVERRDPRTTTTRGTGELIAHALDSGIRRIKAISRSSFSSTALKATSLTRFRIPRAVRGVSR